MPHFYFCICTRNTKIQARGASSETKRKKEERNREWEEACEPTPAAGALFEVQLAAQTTNDTHRAEHGEADQAPARVSAPSAGEGEKENVQK